MKFDTLITEAVSTGGKVYLLVWENSWEDDTGEGYQLYGVFTSPAKAYEGYQQYARTGINQRGEPSQSLQVLECKLDPEDVTGPFFRNFKEMDIEYLKTLANIGPETAEKFGDIINKL